MLDRREINGRRVKIGFDIEIFFDDQHAAGILHNVNVGRKQSIRRSSIVFFSMEITGILKKNCVASRLFNERAKFTFNLI